MISTRTLGELRVAATLTHALPGLRTLVRTDGRTVLDVRSAPAEGYGLGRGAVEPEGQDGALVISPCAFRSTVAKAHRHHEEGRRPVMLGLGDDPVVELRAPEGGEIRPGGLVRVALEDRWLWAFGTTLDPMVAFELGESIVDVCLEGTKIHALGIRPDEATGVNIAFAELRAPVSVEHEEAAVEILERLLARWTAHELLVSSGARHVLGGAERS